MIMFELVNVSKSFAIHKSNRFTAVSDVTLNLRQGEITVLKGPSGSGKTTLLSLLGCMARPTSGRIRLHGIKDSVIFDAVPQGGIDISSLPDRFLTQLRRLNFGFIFQQFNLVRGISVLENVMLPAAPTGVSGNACKMRALELLETFNIARHASSRVEWLSGGELQRVAIVRSLINDPCVIVADEPTAHLDSTLSEDFMDIVATFKEAGKTVVIASHDPIVYGADVVDTVLEMRDGRIVGAEWVQ